MDGDVLVGGASAVFLLIFLVQTARETFDIPSRFVPAATLVIGLVLFTLVAILPEAAIETYAQGLVAIAAASAAVRYVKNGKENEQPRYTVGRIQEQPRDDQWGRVTSRTTQKVD